MPHESVTAQPGGNQEASDVHTARVTKYHCGHGSALSAYMFQLRAQLNPAFSPLGKRVDGFGGFEGHQDTWIDWKEGADCLSGGKAIQSGVQRFYSCRVSVVRGRKGSATFWNCRLPPVTGAVGISHDMITLTGGPKAVKKAWGEGQVKIIIAGINQTWMSGQRQAVAVKGSRTSRRMGDPSENAGYKWQVYAPRGVPSGFTSCAVTKIIGHAYMVYTEDDRAGRNAEGMPPRGERETERDTMEWIYYGFILNLHKAYKWNELAARR
ncbi:hypothetical protein EDD17DRAFT_1505959 [Pisolithus thermaeus]|nr:hypothetical protein EV401DRAFT_1894890 [Pisolithus croceorrhizus]KAI6165511.1 hypothetical protein EDD17DRAFT_1505959 [Pisolithus thermaeus]